MNATQADVGESLAHLGDLLRSFGLSDRGRLDEAAVCYERALKIREAAHGASHRVVAVTLHGYAQGRTRERNSQLQRLISRPVSTRSG